MGITVYSLSWVMRDLYHQPYYGPLRRPAYDFWQFLDQKASDLLMVANDASPRADQLLHSMLQMLGAGYLGFRV